MTKSKFHHFTGVKDILAIALGLEQMMYCYKKCCKMYGQADYSITNTKGLPIFLRQKPKLFFKTFGKI